MSDLVTERFNLNYEGLRDDIVLAFPHNFGFNGFGEVTYNRTYTRVKEDGYYEEWIDTCMRVVNGVLSIRKNWYKLAGLKWDEVKWRRLGVEMLQYIYQMKFLPPGRGLWAMGTDHVYKLGSMALCNCANTSITTLFDTDLSWAMDALMCGCGVGFRLPSSSEQSQIRTLLVEPITTTWSNKRVYVIPDTREGWVESVRLLLESYKFDSKDRRAVYFDYSLIRGYGEPIKGFGGTASGPGPLMILHHRIRAYFDNFLKGHVSIIRLFADTANAIGCCVVMGNVRRSAEILIGSQHDKEFLNLKAVPSQSQSTIDKLANFYRIIEKGAITEIEYGYDRVNRITLEDVGLTSEDFLGDRWSQHDSEGNPFSFIGGLSNNTCVLETTKDFTALPNIVDNIRENGEPGIINLLNIQRYGRYGDEKIDLANSCNPCGEIPLEDKELCNLVEVFPTLCETEFEFYKATELATLYAQTVSLLPTHSFATNQVIARNRRIGVSLTGIADYLDVMGAVKLTKVLRGAYKVVDRTVDKWAKESGVPKPIRTTTIKPSGTVSQLPGVSSGMHFPTFQYAIRRIRVAVGSVVDKVLKDADVPFEVDVTSRTTNVFEFPINQGSTRSATSVSAWEQFSLLAMLQREWADNMVSCTVYFDPKTEGKQIEQMLGQFAPLIKSVSMLPHTEAGAYAQMPYEGLTKKRYEKRLRDIKPLIWPTKYDPSELQQSQESILYCDSDSCEII